MELNDFKNLDELLDSEEFKKEIDSLKHEVNIDTEMITYEDLQEYLW